MYKYLVLSKTIEQAPRMFTIAIIQLVFKEQCWHSKSVILKVLHYSENSELPVKSDTVDVNILQSNETCMQVPFIFSQLPTIFGMFL